MRRSLLCSGVLVISIFVLGMASGTIAKSPKEDFGAFVADQLRAHSEQLFGFKPLEESVLGPYDGPDDLQAIQLAPGLQASIVSTSTASAADQIAMWPDNDRPTHLFVCDEETTNPAVQRIDLSLPAGSNTTTIVTGLASCDPVRRTPWGTILVGEENGALGGLYELIDPVNINSGGGSPINVSNRDAGTTSDSLHLVKRKTVGSLSFEGIAIQEDGTMIFADELAPSAGNAGGGVYKFVPTIPYQGTGPIAVPSASPLAAGVIYGLRVAASGSSNWGQGAETGKGAWVAVNLAGSGVVDGNGNVILRTAQLLQKFTGYYRPEDMDIDPVGIESNFFRACWANTGRKSHNASSVVENGAVESEVMCLVEEPPSAAVPMPATGTIPTVERFIAGSPERAMYDNLAFQPFTGNLVVLEDMASLNVVTSIQPPKSELRGDDLWMCLPDGADDDAQTDGCVRFGSIRDTTAEPSGFIFLGSGEEAFVNIQHRAHNDNIDIGHKGALIRISGFKAQ